ncbi:MAG: hypothetical protein HYS35_05735 [Betaproteobacteria bacterium]|nr:hypothetical protein [Betaproteobacteria bacterium]
MRLRAALVLLLTSVISVLAPVLGLALAGLPVAGALDFPPRTRFVPHAPFDWIAFAAMSLPLLAAAVLFGVVLSRNSTTTREPPARPFPWWGWLGLALLALSWLAAWREGLVAADWRRHVFTTLWLGFIVFMNALTHRRAGRSLLTHRAGWFIALFPASACFWWIFEHLNRFTGNWYYAGIEAGGDWDYFVQATLPFSTVLPAVASVADWLGGLARLRAMALPALRGHAALAPIALGAGTLALMGLGLWPETLFSMLWLAPLLVLAGLQQLLMGETLLAPLARGDWRPVLLPALAALACGLLWEMWNWGSLAKWHYSIPYVDRFRLFEMPLLGYAGYLPFGLECAFVMDLVARARSPRGATAGPP